MNIVGTGLWGQLLRWMDHPVATDQYARLKRLPIAHDCTPSVLEFFEGGSLKHDAVDAAFNRVAKRLRAARIVFVPALLSGLAIGASRLRLIEYLTHQVRRLRDEGFDAQLADVDTGAPVARNAATLADMLVQAHRPTWIISHSKGGLDTLETLLARPELQRFVEGWISFQAPFLGSPVADAACDSGRARRIGSTALSVLGADLQAVCDLRTDVRLRYMDARAVEIAKMTSTIPVMSVGTHRSFFLPPTGRWMNGMGLRNDGLVPIHSTILPGSRFAVLEGLAHGEPATRHLLASRRYEHVDLLKVLLSVLVQAGQDTRKAAA